MECVGNSEEPAGDDGRQAGGRSAGKKQGTAGQLFDGRADGRHDSNLSGIAGGAELSKMRKCHAYGGTAAFCVRSVTKMRSPFSLPSLAYARDTRE